MSSLCKEVSVSDYSAHPPLAEVSNRLRGQACAPLTSRSGLALRPALPGPLPGARRRPLRPLRRRERGRCRRTRSEHLSTAGIPPPDRRCRPIRAARAPPPVGCSYWAHQQPIPGRRPRPRLRDRGSTLAGRPGPRWKTASEGAAHAARREGCDRGRTHRACMVGALAGREHRNRGGRRSRYHLGRARRRRAQRRRDSARAAARPEWSAPSTKTARTGGGGAHYLLVSRRRGSGASAPGLDLLGRGSCILVAPSLHPCGLRMSGPRRRTRRSRRADVARRSGSCTGARPREGRPGQCGDA